MIGTSVHLRIFCAHLDAVQTGEKYVKYYEVDLLIRHHMHGLSPVQSGSHLVALFGQVEVQQITDLRLIIDYKNSLT